jgi:hypothetical protein
MTLLVRHVKEDVLRLFCHVLTSYFNFSGQPYERTDGMSSPLLSVISRFFMEDFGEMALDGSTHKSLFWFHYIATRSRQADGLPDHQNIHLPTGTERDGLRYAVNLPIGTAVSSPALVTTHPTNIPYFSH